MYELRRGQKMAYLCVRVNHLRLCRCVCVCVYLLSKSIMPFRHYGEGVLSATNAVPDHSVNSLIFNAAVHYAERSHTHSLRVGQIEQESMDKS